MIQLTNTVAQTLAPGQVMTFNVVKLKTGCAECFNSQVPTSVKLCGRCGIYELHFSGNITGAAANAPVQLAMAVGDSPLVETAMNYTPTAAGALGNVHTSTLFKNDCCDVDRVSIRNTGANPLTIAPNANFYITRKA